MPERKTLARARAAKSRGKAASTQAGEFVREEIHHVRRGKHGARSSKQAIAIGLSKARRAGVKLRAPKKGTTSASVRRKAKRELTKKRRATTHRARSVRRGLRRALRREGRAAASRRALSAQARAAAARRSTRIRKAMTRRASAHTPPKGHR
jgi:hypothetical protein